MLVYSRRFPKADMQSKIQSEMMVSVRKIVDGILMFTLTSAST